MADWAGLCRPGVNGFVLYLVALKWWHDISPEEIVESGWTTAVAAVYTTLKHLHNDAL